MACGFIAGLFPFFYACSVLRFTTPGLTESTPRVVWTALLCWQKTEDVARVPVAYGFGLSPLGALLTHVYALYLLAPFVVVELYNLLNREQPNWGIVWATLLALATGDMARYICHFFRIYRVNVPTTFEAASHDTVQHFLEGRDRAGHRCPFTVAIDNRPRWCAASQRAYATGAHSEAGDSVGRRFRLHSYAWFESGCKIAMARSIDRDFLSSVAGYAILLGFATSRWQVSSWTAQSLAGCMFLPPGADLGTTAYLGRQEQICAYGAK